MTRDNDHFYRFLAERFRPVDQRLIFLIMPFAPYFDQRYDHLFKIPLQNAGFKVRRSDEIYGTSEVIGNVIRSLQEARLILADRLEGVCRAVCPPAHQRAA
jgi:hypothetical protein